MAVHKQEAGVDLTHVESDYVRRVLGEPLHHGLCALILYHPADPIDFLANYLRYWVKHVRTYRREVIAEIEIEKYLRENIAWNVGVVAEKAKMLEQKALDEARRIAEEEARRAAIEKARIKAATDEATQNASDSIRNDTAVMVLNEIIEKTEELAFKKWQAAEKARIKAEEEARRRALEEEEAMAEGQGGEGEEGKEEEEQEEEDEE
ncbi:unnamed protein product [Calicophoron daubneyi]|uniref:Uncharacterized protein n=1 Tax=Calicophoron daubneyi TaxID=300641 RepID=A0AAV2TF17_CALDB